MTPPLVNPCPCLRCVREDRDRLAGELNEVHHALTEALAELPEGERPDATTTLPEAVQHLAARHRGVRDTAARAEGYSLAARRARNEADQQRSLTQVGLHLLHQFLAPQGWKGTDLGEGIRLLADQKDVAARVAREWAADTHRLSHRIEAAGDPPAEMKRLSNQLDEQATTHRLQLRAHEDSSRAAYEALAAALGPTGYANIPDGIRKLAQRAWDAERHEAQHRANRDQAARARDEALNERDAALRQRCCLAGVNDVTPE